MSWRIIQDVPCLSRFILMRGLGRVDPRGGWIAKIEFAVVCRLVSRVTQLDFVAQSQAFNRSGNVFCNCTYYSY